MHYLELIFLKTKMEYKQNSNIDFHYRLTTPNMDFFE